MILSRESGSEACFSLGNLEKEEAELLGRFLGEGAKELEPDEVGVGESAGKAILFERFLHIRAIR